MIEVQGLNKTYGQKQVLTNVSFKAENGLVTGFVGPNGAGKSTTMRMVAALENPDSGTTLVDGRPFSKAAAPARTLGIYLGSDYLPNHMAVGEYLAYVCATNGIDKASIPTLLQMVELAHVADKPISSFSLGMRQRAGLAAALAGSPDNLMLDEPVNGLDPMGVQWLRGVIREQASAGRAVLLSSHLLSELELVADSVVMLDQGQVVRMGSMRDLASETGPLRVLMHTSNDQAVGNHLVQNGIRVEASGGMLLVTGLTPENLANFVVKSNLRLYHLEVKQSSLEELFMSTATAFESGAQGQVPSQVQAALVQAPVAQVQTPLAQAPAVQQVQMPIEQAQMPIENAQTPSQSPPLQEQQQYPQQGQEVHHGC